MSNCKHEKQIPMPDSIAMVCERCGQVFIEDQPWAYRSGNIIEWLRDLCDKDKKEAIDEH